MTVIAELTLRWKQKQQVPIDDWVLKPFKMLLNWQLFCQKKKLSLRRGRVGLAHSTLRVKRLLYLSQSEGVSVSKLEPGPEYQRPEPHYWAGREADRRRSISGWTLISRGGDDTNINVLRMLEDRRSIKL